MNDEFYQQYLDEAKQVLKSLEESLLQLEKQGNAEELNNTYRYLHTLKGGAGMFGLDSVERLSHELESVYSEIRSGMRALDEFILDLTFQAIDILSDLIDGKDVLSETEEIISSIKSLTNTGKESEQLPSEIKESTGDCFLILLKPKKEVFRRGINLQALLSEIYALGNYEQIIHNEFMPLETQFKNKDLTSWFEIFVQSNSSLKEVKEIFLFMQPSEFAVISVKGIGIFSDELYQQFIPLTPEDIEIRIELIKKFDDDIFNATNTKKEAIQIEDQADEKDESGVAIIRVKKGGNINVPTQKLDHLINIVSELVIFRSELHHLMEDTGNTVVSEALEKLERLTLGLRDSAFNIRLIPLNILSVKLQRLIRIVSRELGKEIEFFREGLDTELDRSMINAIEAPLMHIIRNAIDHGIETPEERVKRNKPRKGLIKLYSYNSGDHIFIQLQDDGNGIDFDKIRKKGIEKGLLNKNQDYSEKELANLMMAPGFSTSDNVTTVSGRGVGMDVVKKEIMALRGDIEISTEKGLGSIFTIRLPLTLTILDTLVISVEDKKYLIPINEVEHCFKEEHSKLFHKKSRQINFNGELLPFVSLREQFRIKTFPAQETVIVVNKNDRRMAVIADEILGTLQTVYKPLNELLNEVDCFSGASILGDGSIALIINALKLAN